MTVDGATLPEPLRLQLVRAAIGSSASDRDLVAAGLTNDDWRTRQLALRAGMSRGFLESSDLRRALTDAHAEVRREAAELLARGGSGDLGGDLVLALDDGDPLVVESAAGALGERAARSAVDKLLIVAGDHPDARCRESAIAALGAIGDERAIPVVIAALDDKPPVRRRAIVALSNFSGSDVDEALARASQDRDWQVRAAVELLNRSFDS
jgi:HEAT repeat protein